MPAKLPAVCSACDTPLGDPSEEVAHPDDPNPPEGAHFKIQQRSDGEERMQCTETGQLAKPLTPDDDGYPHDKFGDGEGGEQQQQQQAQEVQQTNTQQAQTSQVYDFKEDKNPIDLLQEVVTNPSYGLDDDQIQEIRAWALDYDGQLPPDTLEDIAGLMDGVQKQTATLMKQRYELKLNKWMAEQNADNRGPSIGMTNPFTQSAASARIRTPQPASGSPSRESLKKARDMQAQEYGEGPSNADVRDFDDDPSNRRQRRREGRREAAAGAFDTMANKAAENIGEQMGTNYGRGQDILFRVLEAKAQKDPDWFLEKAQQFEDSLGISIWDIFDESEAKRSEGGQPPQPAVDNESDEALKAIINDDPPATPNTTRPQQQNGQTQNNNEREQHDDELRDMFDEDETQQEEEDQHDGKQFEEIFGDQ